MIQSIQRVVWNQLEKVCNHNILSRSIRLDLIVNDCLYLFIALKIHITAEMNDELASIGGFKTEHRGLIDVKVRFSYNILHKTSENINNDNCFIACSL